MAFPDLSSGAQGGIIAAIVIFVIGLIVLILWLAGVFDSSAAATATDNVQQPIVVTVPEDTESPPVVTATATPTPTSSPGTTESGSYSSAVVTGTSITAVGTFTNTFASAPTVDSATVTDATFLSATVDSTSTTTTSITTNISLATWPAVSPQHRSIQNMGSNTNGVGCYIDTNGNYWFSAGKNGDLKIIQYGRTSSGPGSSVPTLVDGPTASGAAQGAIFHQTGANIFLYGFYATSTPSLAGSWGPAVGSTLSNSVTMPTAGTSWQPQDIAVAPDNPNLVMLSFAANAGGSDVTISTDGGFNFAATVTLIGGSQSFGPSIALKSNLVGISLGHDAGNLNRNTWNGTVWTSALGNVAGVTNVRYSAVQYIDGLPVCIYSKTGTPPRDMEIIFGNDELGATFSSPANIDTYNGASWRLSFGTVASVPICYHHEDNNLVLLVNDQADAKGTWTKHTIVTDAALVSSNVHFGTDGVLIAYIDTSNELRYDYIPIRVLVNYQVTGQV